MGLIDKIKSIFYKKEVIDKNANGEKIIKIDTFEGGYSNQQVTGGIGGSKYPAPGSGGSGFLSIEDKYKSIINQCVHRINNAADKGYKTTKVKMPHNIHRDDALSIGKIAARKSKYEIRSFRIRSIDTTLYIVFMLKRNENGSYIEKSFKI